MKKIALYILAAAAILAGCSKKNIETTPVNSEDAWMYDATLPVPIRLSTCNNLVTKAAAINSLKDMEGKTFGFFAVNENAESWKIAAETTTMPYNAAATVKVGSVADDAKEVRFEFDKPYYYSQTSWDPHTFYGYHAIVNTDAGEKFTAQPDSIYVTINLGRTDVLWGKAKAEELVVGTEVYEGFNARYLRNGGAQPRMNFKHLTSCVSFNAKTKKPKYAENMDDADIITITGVKVLDTYVKTALCIANRTRPETEGTFQDYPNQFKNDGVIELTKDVAGTQKELNVALGEESVTLGEDLFLYPSDELTIELTYTSQPKGATTAAATHTSTYTLKPSKDAAAAGKESATEGFEAGYKYTYTLVVYSPERIVIEAEVEPYVPAFGENEWVEVTPDNE